MIIQIPENLFSIFFWAAAGIATGIGYNILVDSEIKKLTTNENSKIISSIFIMSAFRILIVVILFFFAFLKDLFAGLACLLTFTISRWLSVMLILRKTYRKHED